MELIESDDISIVSQYIHEYLNQDSLVLFDIDNTIIQLSQTLGTPHWFSDFYHQKRREGFSDTEAAELTVKIYLEVNTISEAELVDQKITTVFQTLRANDISILGLTSRDDSLHEATMRQLKSGKLSFNSGKLSEYNIRLNIGERSEVRNGIIFAGGQDKGKCLELFFSNIHWAPKKIIFIDDQLKNLEAVESVLQRTNIDYVGIRYSAMDNQIENMNSKLHEFQLQHFQQTGRLLSDQEALIALV